MSTTQIAKYQRSRTTGSASAGTRSEVTHIMSPVRTGWDRLPSAAYGKPPWFSALPENRNGRSE